MMARHKLKTWPEPFVAVKDGRKSWEYRKDDRGFQVGDVLVLEHWDPSPHRNIDRPIGYAYDGGIARHSIERTVTYILHGGRFGIPVGYCVMSLGDGTGEGAG